MSFTHTYQNSWTFSCVFASVNYEPYFDAWGKRRNADSWEYDTYVANPDFSWVRGFTGHEHHDEFGIINMNNRMYDPVIARMMGTDNYVQSPYFTQSYNRYSYVWNNPMSYTDPTGDIIDWVAVGIGIGAGAYIGASIANNSFSPYQWAWKGPDAWKTYAGMFLGGVAGGLGGQHISGLATAKQHALLSNSFAGILNAMYNYQEGQGALMTMGYFAAAYIGSNIGVVTDSGFAAMAVGGITNAGMGLFESAVTGNEMSAYYVAQKVVGGALSALAGVGFYSSLTNSYTGQYLFGNKSLFGKSKMAAPLNKATFYGIQSSAADFAYTKEEYYRERTFARHAIIFAGGFGNGIFQSFAGKRDYDMNLILNKTQNFGISAFGYAVELGLSNWARSSSFPNGWYPAWEHKAMIYTTKDLFYSLSLR